MIPREQGSDTTRVEIHGGVHDGATGTIMDVLDEGDGQVVTVALDTGGTVELSFETARETASRSQTLRTIGS